MTGFKINGNDVGVEDWSALCEGFGRLSGELDISEESIKIYTSDNELTHDEIFDLLDRNNDNKINADDLLGLNAGNFQSMEGLLSKHGFKLSKEIVFDNNSDLLPPFLWSNKELVLEAVQKNGLLLEHAKAYQNDKDVVLAAIEQDGRALEFVDPNMPGYKDIVLAAVKKNGLLLEFVDPAVPGYREVALTAVKQTGCAIEYARAFWDDKEIALAAVRQNGFLLQFVKPTTPDYREVVLAAVKENGQALEHAGGFQNDREVVLAAIEQDGMALEHARGFQNDREVVLMAVKQNGRALQLAETFQDDREVVLAAVKQNGQALDYARAFWGDKEVALAAVRQNGSALKYVDKKMKEYRAVALEAVWQNGSALMWVDPGTSGYRDIALMAVRREASAFEHVGGPLQKKRQLLFEAAKANIGILRSPGIVGRDAKRLWKNIRDEYAGRFKALFGNAKLNSFDDFKKALKDVYDIEFPERFRSLETLLHVLELRRDPMSAKGKVAILISPKSDWNGAFEEFPVIDRLEELGYDVIYYEAGNENDARASLEHASANGERKAELAVLAGHGNEGSLALGAEDPTKRDKVSDEIYDIDTSDFKDGRDDLELSSFIKDGGDLILDSCSNGKGGEANPNNLANTIAAVLPNIYIQSSPEPMNIRGITLDQDGRPIFEWTAGESYTPSQNLTAPTKLGA